MNFFLKYVFSPVCWGQLRPFLSFLSLYTEFLQIFGTQILDSCPVWFLALVEGGMSIGTHDICLSLLAWWEVGCFPCEVYRNPCHFCIVCRKCGDRNLSHSCYIEALQSFQQGPICWGLLGYREVIFISLSRFILCFHWGGLLASSQYLRQQLGVAGDGRDNWGRFQLCQ